MNRRSLILPGFVSLGYIPLLILLISTSYFRGKRYKDSDYYDSKQWNTQVFLLFLPQFAICILYLAYPIFMFIYKNTWTNTILHIFMIVMSIVSGAALAAVLLQYDGAVIYGFKEIKPIMTGLLLLLFIQFVAYSIWPLFAKMKLKTLSQANLEHMYILKAKHLVLIIVLAAVITWIGFLCFTGALITDTVVFRDVLKDYQNVDSIMFEYAGRYLMIVLFPVMIALVGVFIFYNKRFSWIVYFVAPISWIVNMLLGFATYFSIYVVTIIAFLIHDGDVYGIDKKFWRASIAQIVGGTVTIIGVSAIMWAWSQLLWTYEVEKFQSNNKISVKGENVQLHTKSADIDDTGTA